MAYRISYGEWKTEKKASAASIQTAICAGMLVGAEAIFRFSPAGAQILRDLLLEAPKTVPEQALMAAAEMLQAGEGWYEGLAVYCATLLEKA